MRHFAQNFLSQSDRLAVTLVGKIRSLRFGILDISLGQAGSIPLYFPGGNEILHQDIIVFPGQHTAEDYLLFAQYEIVQAFWTQKIIEHFAQHKLRPALDVSFIDRLIRHMVMERYSPPWLPPTLTLDIDLLLPETTERHTWDGRRSSIFSLSQLERLKIQRFWNQKQA